MDLSIVIVSVNSGHFLPACLSALHTGLGEVEAELLVVDNRCDDNTVEVTREVFPEASIISTDARLGFARANNLALAEARGRHLLLLNPDTEIEARALETVVGYLDDHPEVGIAGARLVNPDGSLQYSCRSFPSLRSVFFRWLPFCPDSIRQWALRDYMGLDWDHATARPVDWVMGACLCARGSAVGQVGLLDAGYFLYYEDIDWCYRMWRGGWEVHYVPDAVVMHHYQRASAQRIFSRTTWLHIRSVARFFLKHRLLRP